MFDHRFRVLLPGLRYALSIGAIGLVLVSCGGSGDDNTDSDGDGGAPAANEAQTIFIEQGCAECHGDEGEGTDQGSSIAGTRMIPQAFETRIRNGRGAAMPAYTEEQVSAEDIQLLYEWLSNK